MGLLVESALMPVKVKFPDGSEQEVTSALRAISTASSSNMVEVPVDNSEWRFIPSPLGWLAQRKERRR